MEHDVASRFDYKEDKCPVCKFTNQNFIKVSDKEFGCYRCGLIFIRKGVREAMFEVSRKMQLYSGFKCECGFKAKSKAGLLAHKRTCNGEDGDN